MNSNQDNMEISNQNSLKISKTSTGKISWEVKIYGNDKLVVRETLNDYILMAQDKANALEMG